MKSLSRKSLEAIVDCIPAGVVVVEKNSEKITYVNDNAIVLFGVDLRQLEKPNRPAELKLLTPKGNVYPLEQLPTRKALVTGNEEKDELIIEKPDGSRRIIEVSAKPILDDNGQVTAAVGIFNDITERKKAEETLKRNQAKEASRREELEALMDAVPAYVVISNNPEGTQMVGNKATNELLGGGKHGNMSLSLQPKGGSTNWLAYDPLGFPIPQEDLPVQKAGKTGKLKFNCEFELRFIDGRSVWLLGAAVPLLSESGKSRGAVGAFIDVTKLKETQRSLKQRTEQLEQIQSKLEEKASEVEKYASRMEELVRERTEKLARSENYSRNLIEASLDPLVTISPDGKITDVNKATEKVTGCSRDELIGSDFSCYFTSPELADAGYKQVLSQGYVRDYPLEIKAKSGKVTEVLYNATIFHDEAGKVQGVFAAARDVTERNKAQAAIRVERKRLFDVLETLPAYVVLLDSDHRVSFANKVFRERFGESHGKRCYEYLFNRNRECPRCITYNVYREGKFQHWYWSGPDGREYDVYDYPFKDSDGSTLILEMGIDVTELKKAEKALEAERQHLFDALESLPVMLAILSQERKITFSNKLFRERFGVASSKLCFEFLFGKDDLCEWCQAFSVLKTGRPTYWRLNCPNGRIFDVYNSPFVETDGSVSILEVLVDITQRVKMEKQLKDSERLAAIGATAGMVGHDIRNPLQAIASDVYLAKSDLLSVPEGEAKENLKESLDGIDKNIDYINKIVQDLQDYARPINPKIEDADLGQIVQSLLIKNPSPENVKIEVNIAEDARIIKADPYYLNRILYNLVTNAVQAMPQGGKLAIDSHREAGGFVITVSDTGVGIPENIRDKMFTLMFTTKSKGQGFGLPVVKRMTESLGGRVTFESQEGKGTAFKVRLPFQ
jgi:PAS domain S-box-containing protein